MATITDQLVGSLMIMLAAAVFFYYTVWVIILPLLEAEHFLHGYFLPRSYAIILPVLAGLLLVAVVGVFVGVVTLKDQAKKKKKS